MWFNIASLALSALGSLQSLQQAQQRQKAQYAQIQQQQRQAALQQQIEERRVKRERDRAVASARARMGSAGVSSSGGSAAAIIGGLRKDFNQKLADSRAIYTAGAAPKIQVGSGFQNLENLGQNVIGVIREVDENLEEE